MMQWVDVGTGLQSYEHINKQEKACMCVCVVRKTDVPTRFKRGLGEVKLVFYSCHVMSAEINSFFCLFVLFFSTFTNTRDPTLCFCPAINPSIQ